MEANNNSSANIKFNFSAGSTLKDYSGADSVSVELVLWAKNMYDGAILNLNGASEVVLFKFFQINVKILQHDVGHGDISVQQHHEKLMRGERYIYLI
jgi:hypothetical protein